MSKRSADLTPGWMKAVIAAMMLPLALYPRMLDAAADNPSIKYLVALYPAYVLATGLCAWIVYPQRHEVAWILLALLALAHAGMFWLT